MTTTLYTADTDTASVSWQAYQDRLWYGRDSQSFTFYPNSYSSKPTKGQNTLNCKIHSRSIDCRILNESKDDKTES